MPLVRNPRTGEIRVVDGDVQPLIAQGWTVPTEEEIAGKRRELEYGTTGQQAQAQVERVVRGATFGLVEGFGDEEEIRARAEVSEQLSPGLSTLAEIAPDVGVGLVTGGLGGLATGAGKAAARGAVAQGAGIARAGLAAARAGGVAGVAGEAAGSGVVGAAQQAYREQRQFLDPETIGQDVENMAIWSGLGFALGATPLARRALRDLRKGGKQAEKEVAEELTETAAASEARHAEPAAATGAAPETPYSLEGKTLQDLGQRETQPEKLAAVRADEEFVRTGRAAGDDQGITLYDDPEQGLRLNDGRHRLTVAREAGLPSVYGTVRDPESGAVLFQGNIPLKAQRAAAREAGEEAAEDGLERAMSRASKAEADDIIDEAVSAAPVEREASGLGRQRRLYQNRREIRKAMVREMQSDLTDVVKDVRAISDTRAVKPEDVSKNISDNIDAQRIAARQVADNAAKFSGQLKAEARQLAEGQGKKGLTYAIPSAQKLTLSLMEHANDIATAKTGAEMFNRLDAFKRVVDNYKVNLETGAKSSADPLMHRQLIPRVEEFANNIRKTLEDQKTWGRAGEMQAAYNATWTDKFLPHFKTFEEAVLKRTHRGYDAMWETEGWESKIASLLENADTGERRHVAAMLDAIQETAEARAKYGSAPKETIKRVTEKVDKIRRTIGLADELDDASQRIEALSKVVGSGGPIGVIGGAIAAGPVGAVAGGMGGGLVREFLTGDIGHAFKTLTGATEKTVARGVDDWIRSSKVRGGGKLIPRPRLPKMSIEAKQIADAAKRRGVTHAMVQFMGEDDSPNKAFERRRAALMDEEAFIERMGGDFKALQELAPAAYMALSAKVAEARAFLIARMPANVAVSMMRPGGYPPSKEAIEDWAVYWNTVERPMDVVKNLASVRVQQLETIQTLYPRLYEQIQGQILERIGASNEGTEPLDDSLLMRLDLLFGFDGAASTAFGQRAANAAKQSVQNQPEAGSVSDRAPKAASRLAPSSPGVAGPTFGTQG